MVTKKQGTFKLKGNTGIVYVPADVVKDSRFPLRRGQVIVEVKGETLVVRSLTRDIK